MDNVKLELLWKSLTFSGQSDFEFVRIDADCIPELNIGLNRQFNRCLILELPLTSKVDLVPVVRQHLSLDLFRDTGYIVIQLTDAVYNDLFNDLVISLYRRIKDFSDIESITTELIQSFHKWSQFFDAGRTNRLLPEQVRGLLGELLVLRELINGSTASKLNEILNSWKGPYGLTHDFVSGLKNIEVKTRDTWQPDVRISSEYQLQEELNKGLELAVVCLDSDMEYGMSLSTLVIEIRQLIVAKLGDTTIMFDALFQHGLTIGNLSEYDNLRFKPISIHYYDCTGVNFPRLTRADLSREISKVNYDIRTTALNDFITAKKIF